MKRRDWTECWKVDIVEELWSVVGVMLKGKGGEALCLVWAVHVDPPKTCSLLYYFHPPRGQLVLRLLRDGLDGGCDLSTCTFVRYILVLFNVLT
jgi:hypothetical protein